MQLDVGFLFYLPLWSMLLFLGILFPLSALFGSFVGKWSAKKINATEIPSNFVPSTILGLLALILGFTFSMTVSRYDTRKALMLKESNEIGTAFLRASTVNEPFRSRIEEHLKAYAQARLNFFTAGVDLNLIAKAQKETRQLQKTLWKDIQDLTTHDRSDIAGLLMSSINSIIDTATEQETAILNRVPELVYILILLVTIVGLGSLGYIDSLHHEKSKFGIIILSLLLAVVVVLIQDMDRPRRGLIKVTQGNFQSLVDDMNSR